MHKTLLTFLLIAVAVSGCVKPLSRGSNFGRSPEEDRATGLFIRGEGFGTARAEIKTISGGGISALSPGRTHGFFIENADLIRQPLTCTTPGVIGSTLFARTLANGSVGAINFTCTSGQNTFPISLAYTAGKITLLSENTLGPLHSAGVEAETPVATSDGRYLFYSVLSPSHSGSGSAQVIRLDTQTGAKRLVSASAAGVAGNNWSYSPSVSSDGRYVSFISDATNLIPSVSGTQIYRKDLVTEALIQVAVDASYMTIESQKISGNGNRVVFHGIASGGAKQVWVRDIPGNFTKLISSTNGTIPGPGPSQDPSISDDGTKITFSSQSAFTGAGGLQVYLTDTAVAFNPPVLVSQISGTPGIHESYNRAISGDGHYVFFRTNSGNLYGGGASFTNVILRKDLQTQAIVLVSSVDGTTPGNTSDECWSVSTDGNLAALLNYVNPGIDGRWQAARKNLTTQAMELVQEFNDLPVNETPNVKPFLSGNGETVAFHSPHLGLLAGVTGHQIYYKKMPGGPLKLASTNDGNTFSSYGASNPFISGDGNFAVFRSRANIYFGNTRAAQIYRRNLSTGEVALVSVTPAGLPEAVDVGDPAVSNNGRYVVFTGEGASQVYRKDMTGGSLTLISQSTSANAGDGVSTQPSLSDDGRLVVFTSTATNLLPGPALPSMQRLYLRNLANGTTVLVSTNQAGNPANGPCSSPTLSAAGDAIAFQCSNTSNMAGQCTGAQVFHKRLDTGVVTLISTPDGTTAGDDFSYEPRLSAGGQAIVFTSRATNLVGTGGKHVFHKSLTSGVLTKVSQTASGVSADYDSGGAFPSANGEFVAFASGANNLVPGMIGWRVYRKQVLAGSSGPVIHIAPGESLDGAVVPSISLTAAGDKISFYSGSGILVDGVGGGQAYLWVP